MWINLILYEFERLHLISAAFEESVQNFELLRIVRKTYKNNVFLQRRLHKTPDGFTIVNCAELVSGFQCSMATLTNFYINT